MVVVARDVTGVSVDDRARGVREGVPDRVGAPVLVARPSIWYAAVATPRTNPSGTTRVRAVVPLSSNSLGMSAR